MDLTNMKSICFIRHAESLSNAGFATETPHAIGLSEKGCRQAEVLAAQWRDAPDLIVTSAYTRTTATAAPLCRCHPQVPVITLPVHELTFLTPTAYAGTTEQMRREPVRLYWERCDPDYCDGEGAESFRAFCWRIDASLEALLARAESRIAVFCHGYVIKAILWRQLHPGVPVTADYMRRFFDFHRSLVVPNVQVYPFQIAPGCDMSMQPPYSAATGEPQAACPPPPASGDLTGIESLLNEAALRFHEPAYVEGAPELRTPAFYVRMWRRWCNGPEMRVAVEDLMALLFQYQRAGPRHAGWFSSHDEEHVKGLELLVRVIEEPTPPGWRLEPYASAWEQRTPEEKLRAASLVRRWLKDH